MNIWWDLDPEQWDRVDQPSFLRPSDRFPPAAASAGDGSRGGQSTNLIGLLRKGQDTWQPPQWGSHIMELGIPYFQSFLSQTSSDCTRGLKIVGKVSFNIASEASYVYILSGQKLIKNAQKMVHFGEFLKTWSLRSNSVTRQVSFNRTNIGRKRQNSEIQMRLFE